MMTSVEFNIWCTQLKLNEQAKKQIEQIRSSEPSRRVGGGRNNVCGRYPSQKMGVTIQFESHRNELAHIYQLEYDENVLEYYDQPPPIFLDYLSKNGRRNYHRHTPDTFVIRKDSAGWEEYKTEKELIKKSQESPNRWQKTQDDKWLCPPGSEVASQLGLYYIVRSSSEINSIFLRNFIWLSDYFYSRKQLSVADEVIKNIRTLISQTAEITLAQIIKQEIASIDDLNILIATNQVYVDLQSAFLGQPEQVRIYLDSEEALIYKNLALSQTIATGGDTSIKVAVGTYIDWDGIKWEIVNPGNKLIGLLGDNGNFIELPNNIFENLVKSRKIHGVANTEKLITNTDLEEILKKASKEDLKTANKRFQEIEQFLNGITSKSTTRTQRRWIKNYQTAQRIYGRGLLGLIPKHRNKGWRRKGIEQEVFELMLSDIEENYENIKQPSIRHTYECFKQKCIANKLKAPSKETYRKAVRKQSQYQLMKKRIGSRGAYKEEPFYWYMHFQGTPTHGDRPFEICHIDHTQVDVELLSSIMLKHGVSESSLSEQLEQINMGRAWATLMIDAYSRRILAVYMTFDPPSYRSNMMILRICVARYGKLPQIIVVDCGTDFDSTDFETLLAYFGITKKQRPPAKPRYGSVIESFFGVADKEFWHNLMGNTQIMKNVRQVTSSVNPKNNAIWTLPKLYAYFCEYCYEVYDNCPHPGLRMSPREAFNIGNANAGNREQTLINCEEFKLVALPSVTTLAGKRKVTQDGVKINYIYYWHSSFSLIRGKKVDVKYDPFDITVAYAYVQGEWVQCQSRYMWELSGHSVRELMIAACELRKLNKLQNYQFGDVTAKKLAGFFKRIEMEESLLTPAWLQSKKAVQQQRLKDAELKQVIAFISEKPIHPEQQPILPAIEAKVRLSEVVASEVINETFEPLEEW
jgi:putative transposase